MAAHALVRASLKDRRTDLDYNLVMTLNVLEAMLSNAIPDLGKEKQSSFQAERYEIMYRCAIGHEIT
ncbi:MAG: hypothetical protein OK457_05820 [Thaumarchaeota archaeon]|nr:hypothetical protein [Nitrososphaerota archaeon]